MEKTRAKDAGFLKGRGGRGGGKILNSGPAFPKFWSNN